jgi:hypothetical protein
VHRGRFRSVSLFAGAPVREAIDRGEADFVPVFLSDIPGLFASGRIRLDAALLQLSPLLVLQSDSQATSLACAFLKLNTAAFQMQLVFFGLWCVLTGYLVWRSAFMPRVLGALLMVDGLGWMLYLWPPLATQLFPLIALASGLAEIPMIVWLIAFGVNSERWRLQAAATLA